MHQHVHLVLLCLFHEKKTICLVWADTFCQVLFIFRVEILQNGIELPEKLLFFPYSAVP